MRVGDLEWRRMVWAVFASSMYAYCTRSVSNAGGIFVNRGFEEAVTDGNLVTGPAWTARVAWLRQFLHVLRTTHRQQYGPRKGDGLIRVAGHALETVSEEWMTNGYSPERSTSYLLDIMGQAWCKSDEERNSLLDSLHRCAMGRCSLVDPRSIRNREGAHSSRITATNPLDLYYMPYTHSLVAAIGWSVIASILYKVFKPNGWSAAALVGAAVFSHWILDLLVHRPDLPLYDNTMKVGFGLWNFPRLAFALEVVILSAGLYFYVHETRPLSRAGGYGMPIFAVVMLLVQGFISLALH